ncbi:hypothetical protein [Streptomyces sp. SLBN-8D4]|uniref:hypothetical protein n=1 Tax=Streptomyces sp. SLBN-8D4 TaxID=3377728 RepID=UPI003C7A8A48
MRASADGTQETLLDAAEDGLPGTTAVIRGDGTYVTIGAHLARAPASALTCGHSPADARHA